MIRILIVEDDTHVQSMFTRVMRGAHAEIHFAREGAEALLQLSKNNFDLIISDVEMPGMDGIAFFKRVLTEFTELIPKFMFFTSIPAEDVHCQTGHDEIRVFRKPVDARLIRALVEALPV